MLKRYLISQKKHTEDEVGGVVILIEAADGHLESEELAGAVAERFETIDGYKDKQGNLIDGLFLQLLDSCPKTNRTSPRPITPREKT